MKKLLIMIVSVMIMSAMAGPAPVKAAGTNTYEFGVQNPDDVLWTLNPLPSFKEQGVNNFYAFYSLDNDVKGLVKASSLIECEYGVNQNSYAKRTMVPKTSDVQAYYDTIPEDQNLQFWWKIDGAGYTCPAGDMSAVIGFKAPADGDYMFNAEIYGGAKDDQGFVSDKADGITFAALYKDKALASKDTGKSLITVDDPYLLLENETITLKKGEYVYFAADPNASFDNDLAHWYITVEAKETAASVTNTPTQEPAVTKKADNSVTNEPAATPALTATPTTEPTAALTQAPASPAETSPTIAPTQAAGMEDNGLLTQTPSPIPQVTAGADASKETASANSTSKKGNSWIVWVVVAAVVLCGAGALVYRKRDVLFKKK